MKKNSPSLRPALEAVSFAARAHQGHFRRDKKTPYISHPYRVSLILGQVFGVTDPRLLAAAVLHDTIEDTRTDFDEIMERFGPETAKWVALLSKDMRLEEKPREEAYRAQLASAPVEVKIIKLADLYDNIFDTCLENLAETISKAGKHLENLKKNAPAALSTHIATVEELIGSRKKEIPVKRNS